jgi:hypothetical protein
MRRRHYTLERLEQHHVPQTLRFTVDRLPTLHRLLRGVPRSEAVSLLDVGTASGAGANLIAQLYQSSALWTRVRVDALDHVDWRASTASLRIHSSIT